MCRSDRSILACSRCRGASNSSGSTAPISPRCSKAWMRPARSGSVTDRPEADLGSFCTMARLVYGMNQSLDGYVDHLEFRPGPALFRHFIEQVRDLAGSVYGRRMYEVMRYWDDDSAEWGADECDFAAAWRSLPKWVVSRSLKSVGPNATLVDHDIEAVVRGLKA